MKSWKSEVCLNLDSSWQRETAPELPAEASPSAGMQPLEPGWWMLTAPLSSGSVPATSCARERKNAQEFTAFPLWLIPGCPAAPEWIGLGIRSSAGGDLLISLSPPEGKWYREQISSGQCRSDVMGQGMKAPRLRSTHLYWSFLRMQRGVGAGENFTLLTQAVALQVIYKAHSDFPSWVLGRLA